MPTHLNKEMTSMRLPLVAAVAAATLIAACSTGPPNCDDPEVHAEINRRVFAALEQVLGRDIVRLREGMTPTIVKTVTRSTDKRTTRCDATWQSKLLAPEASVLSAIREKWDSQVGSAGGPAPGLEQLWTGPVLAATTNGVLEQRISYIAQRTDDGRSLIVDIDKGYQELTFVIGYLVGAAKAAAQAKAEAEARVAAEAKAVAKAEAEWKAQVRQNPDAPALYNQVCAACHDSGVAGAPRLGRPADWAPRLAHGLDRMVANAIRGGGAMPPRGGSTASDADIAATVRYMVRKSNSGAAASR